MDWVLHTGVLNAGVYAMIPSVQVEQTIARCTSEATVALNGLLAQTHARLMQIVASSEQAKRIIAMLQTKL